MNKLGHVAGRSLVEAENKIAALPELVKIIAITEASGGQWYIHFEVGNFSDNLLKAQPEKEVPKKSTAKVPKGFLRKNSKGRR